MVDGWVRVASVKKRREIQQKVDDGGGATTTEKCDALGFQLFWWDDYDLVMTIISYPFNSTFILIIAVMVVVVEEQQTYGQRCGISGIWPAVLQHHCRSWVAPTDLHIVHIGSYVYMVVESYLVLHSNRSHSRNYRLNLVGGLIGI